MSERLGSHMPHNQKKKKEDSFNAERMTDRSGPGLGVRKAGWGAFTGDDVKGCGLVVHTGNGDR